MLESKTIVAFDYGEKRAGMAVGNTMLKIPHPLLTIQAEGVRNKITQISTVIDKWQPQQLVVGCPHESDDPQKTKLVNTIKNFAAKLSKHFELPVAIINEDFSSMHASALLREQGIGGQRQKSKLDQLAACSILEYYFNEINKLREINYAV